MGPGRGHPRGGIKGVTSRQHHSEVCSFSIHSRAMSVSSSVSSASSTRSHKKSGSFDPLSLHPPLSLNSSPVIPEEDHYDNANGFDMTEQESQDWESLDDKPFYYNQDRRRRTYVYDQHLQWPLKDWQTVPPGLANMAEEASGNRTTHQAPQIVLQRRPRNEDMSPLDMFVKRGDWKRRGVVFQLSSDSEDEQIQPFEVQPAVYELPSMRASH